MTLVQSNEEARRLVRWFFQLSTRERARWQQKGRNAELIAEAWRISNASESSGHGAEGLLRRNTTALTLV